MSDAQRSSSSPPIFEAARDQAESSFTVILRELWASHAHVLAVVFVDRDGECVDYCSALPPFDAKVSGAHLRLILDEAAALSRLVGAGQAASVELTASRRELIVRGVGDGYALIVVAESGGLTQPLLAEIERTVARLRREAGIAAPSWDPAEPSLEVLVRDAVGWPFAPASFVSEGVRHEIVAVLGRWEERGGPAGGGLTCFRVRADDDVELTLAFDEAEQQWLKW